MPRYHIPNRLKLKEQTEIAAKMGYSNITQLCFDRRLYIKELSKVEKTKHELFIQQAVCSEETLPPMGELLFFHAGFKFQKFFQAFSITSTQTM